MASTIDTSGIDATKPSATAATTASVRDNFSAIKTQIGNAKTDIEALQAGKLATNGDGSAVTSISAAGTTARNFADRFADAPNAFDFIPSGQHAAILAGTTDYDATDDIQALLDESNRDAYLLPGKYLIAPDTLTVSASGKRLMAWAPGGSNTGMPRLHLISAGKAITVTAFNVYVGSLAFYGVEYSDVGGTGLHFEKLANTDDVDAVVHKCLFYELAEGIRHIGRGLECFDNDFTRVRECCEASWPTSGVVSTGTDWQDVPYGYRGMRFSRNRAHSVGVFLKTTGANREYMRGAEVIGTLMDVGGRLFEGGLRDSIFSLNRVFHAAGTIVSIDAGGDGVKILGEIYQGTAGDAAASPGYAVWFDTGAAVRDVTVQGCYAAHVKNEAFRFSDGLTNGVLAGNTGYDLGMSAGGASALYRFGGTVAKTRVTGNAPDTHDLIGGSYTDGGGNEIQGVTGALVPDGDGTRDVGASSARYKDGHFSGVVTAEGGVKVGGTAADNLLSLVDDGANSYAPTVSGSVTAGTQTYSVQVGDHVQIGSLIVMSGRIVMTAKDAATSGSIRISLPVAMRNTSGLFRAVTIGTFGGLNTAVVGLAGEVAPNGSYFTIYKLTAAATAHSTLTAADITDTFTVDWTVVGRAA